MKRWLIFIILVPIFYGFYYVNGLNYLKVKQIHSQQVTHPEMLPKAENAKFGSIGFHNFISDLYWIRTIQYIGGNAISGEYKKYLFAMMDIITELNPYFESPYVLGQLLLPSSNQEYEDFSQEEIDENVSQGEALGLKGVKNFCDSIKVRKIFEENDLDKIQSDPDYKNPCKNYKIPYYLAYIYYFYKQDGVSASNYYKVVAAQDDAPSGARVLAAIMQGKGGERKKSVYMFLSLAKSLGGEGEACTFMTDKLQLTYDYLENENLPLTGEMIQAIENDSKIVLPKLTEENEKNLLSDTECTNYLAKAIRELNLMYLEDADAQYIKDNPDELSAQTPAILLEKGYINFIPTDFQQYSDKSYGIIYQYNEDIKRFDYQMGY